MMQPPAYAGRMNLQSRQTISLMVLFAVGCVPAGAMAQSILGSAGNFTVLGGAAVANTGSSVITSGNVGSATAVTGFPPGNVTGGGVVTIDPTVVSPALADLIRAENRLAAMPYNIDESGLDLGGMKLLPGVYKFSAGAILTGALQLDANGQNNAFWVFQIGSTLTTAINANVTLINPGTNGGSDDGIYWDAGTGITIGGNNQILGNYLAGTSTTFGGTSSGSGRDLARSAVTLDSNHLNSTGGPSGSDWTGGLMYNASFNIVPVPEPAVLLWLAVLVGMFAVLAWRRLRLLKIVA
jgi:hypothetical protein